MEVTGNIKAIFETQTFDSGFSKREIVLTTNEQWPQDIKLEFFKDKCPVLDKYEVGQQVTVAFNLRGSEYNGKYYVNLNGWKIEAANEESKAVLDDEAKESLPF
jgi:hypothetical protein